AASEDLVVVELVEYDRVGVAPRIGVVDPVDLGTFEDRLRTDFQRTLGGCGVRGEEWCAQACPEDHDTAFLLVANGAARNVGLGDLAHVNRGLHTGGHAHPFEQVLQAQTVDDGYEHTHVVGATTFDTTLGELHPTEHVAATDHDRDLNTLGHGLRERLGHVLDDLGFDPQSTAARERLP